MRRLRVTVSMKKQLAEHRDARGQIRRGGVMRVPHILDCEEWEALAIAQQDVLIAASFEDRIPPQSVVTAVPLMNNHKEPQQPSATIAQPMRQ